jgi:hypothetical protein
MSNGIKTGKDSDVTGNASCSDLFHMIDQLKAVPEIHLIMQLAHPVS